ncbi:MAG: ABC transporter permease [Eubacterium sp.]|nr:ABC transporter permease [Eubacterium sp.]
MMLKELYDYREMIKSLVKKELRARYKGSFLGFLWTFVNPLLQLLVYSIVFSVILRMGIENYSMFLFVALVPWIFFSSSITSGSTVILQQQDLVKKIYFPREVLPIAYVTSCFINMLFSFVIIFSVLLIQDHGLYAPALLVLPVVMAVEYILTLGFTFLTCALTVYFRDLEHILSIVAMAWMYLTPVLYAKEMIPEQYRYLEQLNPMTSIITAYRDILFYKKIPHLHTLTAALLIGIISLVLGMAVFSRLKKGFAEEL